MPMERVQKILARAGIASRRQAEELISLGQVTVNGRLAQLGDRAELGRDAIKVNGKLLRDTEAKVYLAFHKPKRVISMLADPEGRATLADFLGKVRARVFPIGRLDFNSEGLILLTNDGDFAEKLQRRDDVPRVYHVKVRGHPTRDMLERLARGTRQGRRLIRPYSVQLAEQLSSKSRIEIVLLGAGAMDLKTLFEHKGFLVERMVRTAIGPITLKGIEPGHYRLLRKSQVDGLLREPRTESARSAPAPAPRGTPSAAGGRIPGPPGKPRPVRERPSRDPRRA